MRRSCNLTGPAEAFMHEVRCALCAASPGQPPRLDLERVEAAIRDAHPLVQQVRHARGWYAGVPPEWERSVEHNPIHNYALESGLCVYCGARDPDWPANVERAR